MHSGRQKGTTVIFPPASITKTGDIRGRSYSGRRYSPEYFAFVDDWASSRQYRDEVRGFLGRLPDQSDATTILDIGCGSGRAMPLIAEKYRTARVKGVDIPQSAVCNSSCDPEVVYAYAEALPFPDQSVDVALFIHSLGHVRSPQMAVAEALRILRIGGLLGVLTPSLEYVRSWMDANPGPCPVEPTVLRYFSVPRITKLLEGLFGTVEMYTYGDTWPFPELLGVSARTRGYCNG